MGLPAMTNVDHVVVRLVRRAESRLASGVAEVRLLRKNESPPAWQTGEESMQEHEMSLTNLLGCSCVSIEG